MLRNPEAGRLNRMKNIDQATVVDFGREWESYDQSPIPRSELHDQFRHYFEVFPWEAVSKDSVGFDVGCGSGRWAQFMAPEVGHLHCVDASQTALKVARQNLRDHPNVTFHNASAGDLPFATASMDFGFSLGVLHHVPDTLGAIKECARILKDNAPLQLYLYYRFDNKPQWYAKLWEFSDHFRRVISEMPFGLKHAISYAIALLVYWPLSRTARILEGMGRDVSDFPLSAYRNQRLYSLKTDALDRFGTRLEQRFTRDEIHAMLTEAGFKDIRFGESGPPYWCVSARRSLAEQRA